jgi:hypothetical protein
VQASRWGSTMQLTAQKTALPASRVKLLQPQRQLLTGGAEASCAMLTSLCKLMTAGCDPGCLLLAAAVAGPCLPCW